MSTPFITTTDAPVDTNKDVLLIVSAVAMAVATISLIVVVRLLEKCLPEDRPQHPTRRVDIEIPEDPLDKKQRITELLLSRGKLMTYSEWKEEQIDEIRHQRRKSTVKYTNAFLTEEDESKFNRLKHSRTMGHLPQDKVSIKQGNSIYDKLASQSIQPANSHIDSQESNNQSISELKNPSSFDNIYHRVKSLENLNSRLENQKEKDHHHLYKSAKEFAQLFITSRIKNDSWTRECAVCLLDFEEDEDILVTPCAHIFHSECLHDWLSSSKTPACPLCRLDFEPTCEKTSDTSQIDPIINVGNVDVENENNSGNEYPVDNNHPQRRWYHCFTRGQENIENGEQRRRRESLSSTVGFIGMPIAV